ncbi:MAG: hypothetical protein ACK5XO_12575, partial [Phycisphaerales bacterium]
GAQNDAAAANAMAAAEVSKWREDYSTATARALELEGLVNSLQAERKTLQDEKRAAQQDAERNKNEIAELRVATQTQATVIKSTTEELTALRKNVADAARRETELVDRLNELDGQRQVLAQNVRALQEQLAEAKLAVEAAAQGRTVGSTDRPIEASQFISTRVSRVMKDAAGNDVAVIAEGSRAGLKPNMRLTISRDGAFVANLILTSVDTGEAVGRVEKLGREVSVSVNDTVLSRVN